MKMHGSQWGSILLTGFLFAVLLTACSPAANAGGSASDPNVGGGIAMTPTENESVPSTGGETPAASTPTAVDPPAIQVETETPVLASETSAGETPFPTEPDPAVQAQSVTAFPDPSGFAWAPVVSDLDRPLDLASPPDGSGRLVILEQSGTIRIAQDGSLLPEPFLDIRSKINSNGSEQGLLGIAFHPDFAENGFFYLNYTDVNGDTVIARYQVSEGDPNIASPDSEKILLQVDQPYANHNGGGMVFGPDGYLYMGLGDGGAGGDPHGNAQSLTTHLGKLLRVDVDGGDPYGIPADNPFASGGGLPENWAYGLRNPWRFSFDRATGDLYIADVGQNAWEEVDFLPADHPAGANFGWDYLEGTHSFEGSIPAGVELVNPIFEYSHDMGCSVTGGYVYRGQELPEFNGIYLVSDYCSGRVWGLLRGEDGAWQSQVLFQTGFNVSSFGEDSYGEIYLINQSDGTVYRLERQ